MTLKIRNETASDVAAIEAVTIAAFHDAEHTSHTEHFIVNALRHAGQLTLSLVADDDGAVVGHVAISPIRLSIGPADWFGLGPLSVLPQRQRQGIGVQLMNHAIAQLRSMGASGCVLLGDPHYSTTNALVSRPRAHWCCPMCRLSTFWPLPSKGQFRRLWWPTTMHST